VKPYVPSYARLHSSDVHVKPYVPSYARLRSSSRKTPTRVCHGGKLLDLMLWIPRLNVRIYFMLNTLYAQYTLCSIHFMLNALYAQYTLCSMHFMLNTLYAQYTLCSIHFMLNTLYAQCTLCSMHFMLNTLYAQCTLCSIHFMLNTLYSIRLATFNMNKQKRELVCQIPCGTLTFPILFKM
jgi:hypothetical protein